MSMKTNEWWITKPEDIRPSNGLAVAWTDEQIREYCKDNEELIAAFKVKRIHVVTVSHPSYGPEDWKAVKLKMKKILNGDE